MSKDKNNKGVAAAAAVGAVAGVVTGILFAPKSGKETRKDIKDAAVKARDKLVSESKKVQIELAKVIDKAEATMKDTSGKVSEKYTEVVASARAALDSLVAKTKTAKDGDDPDFKEAMAKAKEAQAALAKFIKK